MIQVGYLCYSTFIFMLCVYVHCNWTTKKEIMNMCAWCFDSCTKTCQKDLYKLEFLLCAIFMFYQGFSIICIRSKHRTLNVLSLHFETGPLILTIENPFDFVYAEFSLHTSKNKIYLIRIKCIYYCMCSIIIIWHKTRCFHILSQYKTYYLKHCSRHVYDKIFFVFIS